MPNPAPQNSVISAITNQPILVAPESERLFASLLQEISGSEQFQGLYEAAHASASTTQEDDEFWDQDDPWTRAFRPYTVTNGVLQIPVYGVLLNKFSYQFGRRATGYQYIERAFNRGMEDPEVKAIAFIVDSPGGEVSGNFELVEGIAARRGEKPIRAFANDHAYSAAYSISSAADQIVMTRYGGVGSVGVVVAHIEMSEMLKDWGITVTFIFAGKHKIEGNQYEKLSDSAKGRIQAKVDRIYGEFTSLVAANRGMEEKAVRDTEALTYDASDAIEVGFADRVGAFDEELAAFAEEADNTENEFMSTKPNTPAATTSNDGQNTITQEQHASAVSAAQAAGAVAERTRINTILGCDEAKSRPKAALSAALKTDMTAEQAVAFLSDLPEEASVATPAEPKAEEPAPAQPNGFNAAMAQSGNPEPGTGDEEASSVSVHEQMLGALASVTGRPRKQARH